MASKLMANAAFDARLLLRPPHQRTVWTVNKLKCPIPGRPTLPPILSSRSYSDSTSTLTPPFPKPSGSTSTPPLPKPSGSTSTPPFPKPSGSTSTPPFPKPSGSTSTPPFPESSGSTSTPPFPESSGSTSTPLFPKSSGSTEGSQSSGPEDKIYSDSTSTPLLPKISGSTEGSQSSGSKDKNWFSPETWDKIPAWVKFLGLSGGLGAFLITFIEYFAKDWYEALRRRYHEYARESAIYNKLKKGPVFEEAIEDSIPRKLFVEEIRQLTTPARKSRLYPLITGEHGTGKTSLITLAVDSMDEPKGVVYVDIPLECDSPDHVAKAVREALEWSPDPVIDSKDSASLGEVLQVFSHVASKYKREYGKIPVLIIDNANRLAPEHQRLLNLFQDYAKQCADKGRVTVVFVSSEGRVPRHMMQRSSWSRSGDIIEINDVSKEEALQYLELRKIDKELAARIHELVGGRMIHLKDMADKIERKGTFEDLRQKMFSKAESQLKSAKILPEHCYHKDGAKIIRALLTKGSISRSTFYGLVGVDTGDKLLETNIFAYHFNAQEITFQSTVMKRYCEEKSARWESGSRTGNQA